MKYNSQWEDITLRRQSVSRPKACYLWGHIARSAASLKKVLWNLCFRSKSKVTNDQLSLSTYFSDHNIFRLNITMHDFLFLHELKPLQKIHHKTFYLVSLEKSIIFSNQSNQISPLIHLHDQVKRVWGLEDFIKIHQILLVHQF